MNRILLQRVTGDASRDCLHFERITLLPLPYQLKEFHTDKPKIIKTKEAFDKTIYIEEEIAFAQSYFAVQTRKQELIEEHIAYIERTQVRTMLGERGIKPEELPSADDIKKLERRAKTQEKQLSENAGKFSEEGLKKNKP